MASKGMWQWPPVVPSLAYDDVPRAVEWLCHAFGFRERTNAGLSWPGGPMAWLELGAALINVTSGR